MTDLERAKWPDDVKRVKDEMDMHAVGSSSMRKFRIQWLWRHDCRCGCRYRPLFSQRYESKCEWCGCK